MLPPRHTLLLPLDIDDAAYMPYAAAMITPCCQPATPYRGYIVATAAPLLHIITP